MSSRSSWQLQMQWITDCHGLSSSADVMCLLAQLFDEAFRKDFPNVQRWFSTLVNQPEFKKVMGEVALAKEALTYQAKKNDKPAPAAKKESKPEPPKKESKPAPAAKVQNKCPCRDDPDPKTPDVTLRLIN